MSHADPASTPPSALPSSVPPAPVSGRRRALGGLLAVLLALGLGGTVWWYMLPRHIESTDDAYVAGNIVRIMPEVPGRVLEILADDTDPVQAGQALVRLDADDAQLALSRAQVALATTVRDICRTKAQWRESVAQEEAALVTWRQCSANLQRREILGRENAVRVEDVQNYRAQMHTAAAQLEAARQRRAALEAQLLQGPVRTQPAVEQAAIAVRQCWLALQRTGIHSPVTGQVAQRSVQAGHVVAAGTSLMAIIPLNAVWVDANFKEVQLRRMRVGQPATVRVDMHGSSIVYKARVAGFAAGTGSAFSLIPPQNATGNWIKIVQRVPVRIELDKSDLQQHPLLVGLSSLVEVDVSDISGPPLTTVQRDRPLPESLRAANVTPSMDSIDALINTIIEQNMASDAEAR